MRDMYHLKYYVMYYKIPKDTLLDVLLTNKPNSFRKAIVCETGLSDYHMLIATTLRSTFIKLPLKTVKYRSYKTSSELFFFMN